MPSRPDKGIQSEQELRMLNSPGVITRSQLKRLSLAKLESVKSCLAFESQTDTNSTPRKSVGLSQPLNEATPVSVVKGRKRKDVSDVVDNSSGRKTRKVQETPKTPSKTEKSKTTKKSSSSTVKKNAKNATVVEMAEPESNHKNLDSDKKKTTRTTKKRNSVNSEPEHDKTTLVEKLLADMKKDLDSESLSFDDSSSQKSDQLKGIRTEPELNNKGGRGKKAAPRSLKCKTEILEHLVPKVEASSPVKNIELEVPKIKKEVSPSKVKEQTITHTAATTSLNGNTEGLSVKADPEIGNSKGRQSSPQSPTGLDSGKDVNRGSRGKVVSDSSDSKQRKVNLNKSPEISNVLYSNAKAEEASDSSDIKQSKAINLNKSLEISNAVDSGSKTKEVNDGVDIKPSKAVNLNKSLEISNVVDSGSKTKEVNDGVDIKPSKVVNLNRSLEISNVVDCSSKAREVSDNSDIKVKKEANFKKSLEISIPSKDSEKVKQEENDDPPIHSTAKPVEEAKNCDVTVADNILKPLVKFSSSPQKVTPRNPSTAQISWQSIKLVDGTSDSDSDAESRKAIMESAQRRIEQNLSTSESESRFLLRIQPCLSDSDSAPECVSFKASSRAAKESLKNAVQSIQRDKQRRKEKRRARLEMLKQQKEEKLIRLKEKLASQVDASCSSSEESGYEEEALKLYKYKKQPLAKAKASVEKENCVVSSELKKSFPSGEVDGDCLLQAAKEVPQNNLNSLPADVLDKLPEKVYPKELKGDAAISKIKKRKKEDEDAFRDGTKVSSGVPAFKKPSTAADFIPLKSSGATKFGVVALDKMGMAPKPISSLAADFKQNMMFGNRHKREPAKVAIAYQQKMQASARNVFARKKF